MRLSGRNGAVEWEERVLVNQGDQRYTRVVAADSGNKVFSLLGKSTTAEAIHRHGTNREPLLR